MNPILPLALTTVLSLPAFAAADTAPAPVPAVPKAAEAPPKPAPAAKAAAKPAPKQENKPMPVPENASEKAPATFKAKFKTTKGDFTVEVTRAWAPNGADRFYNMVKLGFFNEIAFFRAIDGFMVQFGIYGDPDIGAKWRNARITDDPASGHSNSRGAVTFAMAGPDSRTTQIFINYGNNGNLDSMGFPPIGKVIAGMEVVDSLHKGYGEGAPRGAGPDQGRVQMEGNDYLKKEFPKLDYIKSAALEK